MAIFAAFVFRWGDPALARAFVGLVALAECWGVLRRCSSKTEGLEDLQPVSGSVSFEGKPRPCYCLVLPAMIGCEGDSHCRVVDDDVSSR